ncbi:helix-turn-helix domain-containing protein [Paenibacillus terrae]|uniref:DNA-binding protein n=1 Tax=Paenibacillus terrae TaxID=159743 RepID=A0A0D7X7Y8_9BACL|nr:helix-turn-helix transcriptional regulator [Paenibacillus terrae]KJD47128.1 DNA-binding protein [Paenibacillus terrae]
MKITPTIRTEIQTYLRRKGLSMTKFGRIIDLNVGTVSSIVTGNRTISMHQLDRITLGMDLPPDYFYERYIEECIMEEPLNWKRISPFLYRCVQFRRVDCLQKVVSILLDKPNYLHYLFELAEDCYEEGYQEAAAYLYENIAEGEKQQHSERLATCQYRLFMIQVGDDQNRNLKAATRFESFVERLDEVVQLDALKDLGNVYRSLREWDKVDEMAKALGIKAEIQYKLELQQQKTQKENTKKPVYPLFVYWAFAHLIQAEVCDAKKDYATSFKHIQKYADLSWVEEKDEKTLKWKNQFREWASANTYVNRLMSGDLSVLPDYVAYFSTKEDEVLSAIDNIVEAANLYNINVDHILELFEVEIQSFLNEQSQVGVYTKQIISERFMHFSKELANYYLNKGIYSVGFIFLLSCLAKSTLINNKSYIIKCVKLYESYKQYASSETKAAYRNLINEVDEDET